MGKIASARSCERRGIPAYLPWKRDHTPHRTLCFWCRAAIALPNSSTGAFDRSSISDVESRHHGIAQGAPHLPERPERASKNLMHAVEGRSWYHLPPRQVTFSRPSL